MKKRIIEIIALCFLVGANPVYLVAHNVNQFLDIPFDFRIYGHITIGIILLGFILISIYAWFDCRVQKIKSKNNG